MGTGLGSSWLFPETAGTGETVSYMCRSSGGGMSVTV